MKDKRHRFQCINRFILLVFALSWVAVIAVAEDRTTLSEHSQDIMSFQFKLIATLLGIVQVLIGFIYISGITSVKDSIRKLFEKIDHLDDKKLDVATHDRICEKVEK